MFLTSKNTISTVKLTKGKYVSSVSGKIIEILDIDVRVVLENKKPRTGLVLYKYVNSDTLRVAPRLWFVEILSNNKPRFLPLKEEKKGE